MQILNTTGLNYHLEQIITQAESRLILISPYLKLSARIKELIEDKNRLKVDMRIIYGKSELNPKEQDWLLSLPYVRLSFCQNLHAKFYANENHSLICSLNLYDFSQINNHELGVLMDKDTDPKAYADSLTEAQRLIRISTENIPKHSSESDVPAEEPASKTAESTATDASGTTGQESEGKDKITSTVLAKQLKLPLAKLYEKLVDAKYLESKNGSFELTDAGVAIGGVKNPNRHKPGQFYFMWPKDISL